MRSWYGSSRFQKGFTLLELMVGIGIAGVLLAAAAPSFRTATANSALRGATIDLITSLNTARGEAVAKRQDITVTAIGGDWSQGWVIDYADANLEDLEFRPEAGVQVIGTDTDITYKPNGTTDRASLKLTVCDGRSGETGREVNVNRMGRLTNKELAC